MKETPVNAGLNHTPGPWTIGREYTNSQDEILAADGRTIAIIWTRKAPFGATARPQFKDVPELQANARLIAAAPELLEAAKIGLAACIVWGGKCEAAGEHILAREAVIKSEQIRAALVNATGSDRIAADFNRGFNFITKA